MQFGDRNITIRALFQTHRIGEEVTICGWVKTRRDSKGGFSFLEVNDGSCLGNLQIVVDDKLSNYESDVLKLYPGASVAVTGRLCESPGSKQTVELAAAKLQVLGYCDVNTYPLQKQRISFEKLREVTHLRARTNTFGAIARVRNALSMASHRFFQERDFHYIHTPIITTNDCEGAGQMFQVTTLLTNATDVDHATIRNFSDDFFGEKTNLTVSGQLEAETYACAMSRVYTFGPTFRAENSNTSRHLSEFWMIEPEMAFADLNDDARLAQDYLRFLAARLLDQGIDDLNFFNKWIDRDLLSRLETIATNEFAAITYTEAVNMLAKHNRRFRFPVQWGSELQTEHERYVTEKLFSTPVIVTDFPRGIKPFYMRVNDDGKTVAAMDVLVPRVGEIIGGSQREERLDVLTERMKELNLDEPAYWWYLDLRRFGTVPHSGFGLGFERLVQLFTGMANIRDVIPFPRTPRNAKF